MCTSCRFLSTLTGVAVLTIFFVLSGCATTGGDNVTSSYEEQRDRTVYETQPVRITKRGSGLGMSGQQVIYVKARADCQGASCEPDAVNLILASGTRNVSWINYDDVHVRADEWSQTFHNVSRREDPELVGVGEFLRLTIGLDDYRSMLRTQSLNIQVGGTDINLSFNQLERFRELAAVATGEHEEIRG